MKLTLAGTGLAAPDDIETAEELAPQIGRSLDWIREKTGVMRRHRMPPGGDQITFGAAAARQALGDGPPPDLLINASGSTRQIIPDGAAFLAGALGLEGISTFSVHTTCLSFLTALHLSANLLETGAYRRILVVSAEHATQSRNLAEPESAALLGDGAGAAVFERGSGTLLAYHQRTWPEGLSYTEVRGGGNRCHPNNPATRPEDNLFAMDGPMVYRLARRRVEGLFTQLFADAGVSRDDVDVIVPHQASRLAVRALSHYGFPEHKVIDILGEYGNCIAASLPMALHTARERGLLRPGALVMLVGTGAGLTVAGALWRM